VLKDILCVDRSSGSQHTTTKQKFITTTHAKSCMSMLSFYCENTIKLNNILTNKLVTLEKIQEFKKEPLSYSLAEYTSRILLP
jgi:hypothetical protein